MIGLKFVRWMIGGAIALVAVPAIGFGRHASHVSAAPALSAETMSVSDTPEKSKITHEATAKHKKLKHHSRKHKAVRSRRHKSTKHHTKKHHA